MVRREESDKNRWIE